MKLFEPLFDKLGLTVDPLKKFLIVLIIVDFVAVVIKIVRVVGHASMLWLVVPFVFYLQLCLLTLAVH